MVHQELVPIVRISALFQRMVIKKVSFDNTGLVEYHAVRTLNLVRTFWF